MKRIIAILVVMTLVPVSSGLSDEIKLRKVPSEVIAAVREVVPGAKFVSAERENEDDEIELIYRIKLERKGMKSTVEARPTGEIIKIEKEISQKEIPRLVTKYLATKYPKAKIRSSVMVRESGKEKPLYDLGITFEETDYQIQVTADGAVEKLEKNSDAAKLPKPVLTAITEKYPTAKITGVVERTSERKLSYVIDVSTDGKESFEMRIDPDGLVLEDERADAAAP